MPEDLVEETLPPVEHTEWYLQLIDELKEIIVEGEFAARWALVETYHLFGKRILDENANFERSKIYGNSLVIKIAETIGRSDRTVYNAIAFAKKYPDLGMLPEGKNTSWSKICKQLLPARAEEAKPAPIVIEDRELLKDIIETNMEYLLDYAEPTEKGYKFFISRDLLVTYYSSKGTH